MNNEKQHSEYKIIETVATPTFDGVSVETHPEDLSEGGDTPLINAKIKIPNGQSFFIGEINNSVFRPYCMPSADENYTLWGVYDSGIIYEGNNQYTGGFKTWLDNKIVSAGYEITGSEGLKKALEVGSTINLNEYETIQ